MAGISQKDIATEVGVHSSTISRDKAVARILLGHWQEVERLNRPIDLEVIECEFHRGQKLMINVS